MTFTVAAPHSASVLTLSDLRLRLTGELLTASSLGYDDARKVQDITVNRHPLAIVRPCNAVDVATAVSFARDHGYRLAVRSGGHSLAQHSMADDAIVIDMSSMKGIEIDPRSCIARLQTGVTSGEFAERADAHDLALTTGDTSSVAFGGLTTGGGIGFMARKYGLTIDNVLAAEVVTADGRIVTATEHENADLFWAIRGGGGNFGVVTEYTVRLASVPQILGGDLVLPTTREVIRGYLEYAASAPDDLTTIANIMHAPPAPWMPAEAVGSLVLDIIVCWTGSIEDGERALAPLRALATPVADIVRPMPYPDIYLSTAHQALPHGASIRSMFADELSDETIDASLDAMRQATTPFSIIHFRGLGGAMSRVDPEATAFAHRGQRYLVSIIGVWLDASEDPAVHRGWTESLWRRIRHEGSGVYVNFLENEGNERLRDAYPTATLDRLAEIKRTYDPTNLFRLNQNVAPRA